jgi:hypothetical protein
VDAHLLRQQVHVWRGPLAHGLAVQKLVDRHRRLVAVGHRGDDVLRPESRIPAEEDPGQRRLHRLLAQRRQAPLVEGNAAPGSIHGRRSPTASAPRRRAADVGLSGVPAGGAPSLVHRRRSRTSCRAASRPRARTPWARGS